jgi:FkbM family methyltransferase
MAFDKIISSFKKNLAKSPKPDSPSDIFSDTNGFFSYFRTVFDIGAHHGNITKKLKYLSPNAIIHAFEPFSKSYEVLLNNFSNDDRVVLNNLAISNFVGDASFYSNVGDETNSLLQSVPTNDRIDTWTQNVSTIKVGTITLDAYADKKGISQIDFIKIDTQGNTFEVLEGSKRLLKSKSVKWIYAEAEFIEIYKSEKRFSEIEIFLRSYDYELMKLYNMNYTEAGCLAWVDALFRLKPTT